MIYPLVCNSGVPKTDPLAPVRRKILQDFCRAKGWELPGGRWSVGEVAKKIRKPVTKTSNLLNGTGSFGSKIAREIEDAAGMPGGYLDGLAPGDGWPFPGIERQRFDQLTPDQKIEIQGMVRRAISDFEAEQANEDAA